MILGIDLSLTRTGLAIYRGKPPTAELELRSIETPAAKVRGMQRVSIICREIWGLAGGRDGLIVLEDYSFGSKGDRFFSDLCELRGVLLYSLWCTSARLMFVSPPSLKKYATGKGNAGKDEVLLAVQKRYGHLVEIGNNDEADALTLVAMACHQYGAALAPVPAVNATALAGGAKTPLDWPSFTIGGDGVRATS